MGSRRPRLERLLMRTPLHYWRINDKFGASRFNWKLMRIYAHDSIDKLVYNECRLLGVLSKPRRPFVGHPGRAYP
jgi:hypothetical protein